MAEVNLGQKHECSNCETKFYDLGRKEAVCPKCGTNQESGDKEEPKEVAASQSARRKRKTEVSRDLDDDEEDDDLDLDDDELDDDELEEDFDDEDLELDDEDDEDEEDEDEDLD